MEGEVFKTEDLHISAYLSMKKFVPQLVKEHGRVLFQFEANEELYRELNNYNGALVEAGRFSSAIKMMRQRLFSVKNGGSDQ